MTSQRPFYFFVVVWGAEYVDSFANFCIPSLLAPGNLPALKNAARNHLLVITPREDWERLRASPVFGLVSRYVEPVHLELPVPGPDTPVYDHMSLGHKLATEFVSRNRAYGVFLAPDMMLSDGSLAAVERHARAGVQVVLTAALRYGEEPMFEHFEKRGVVSRAARLGEEARPLCISPRDMACAAVNGFHHETLRFEWDAPYFAPFYTGLPGVCFWRVPGEDGVLLHSSSWAPLLIDYGAIPQHDSSTMDHWAIDGDYVHRNFGTTARIHVVQDSDEIMLVSWTPMHVLALPRKPKRLLTRPRLGPFLKGCLLRDAFLGPYSDPLKRRISLLPVRFHAADVNPAWQPVEARAAEIIERYLVKDGPPPRRLAMRVVGAVNRIFILLVGRWANRRRVFKMAGKALRGDPAALDYLKRRSRLYLDQIIGRSAGRN